MKLELYNTKTMKLEIMTLEDCEPGTIYLVPKIVRCKKCDCIIQHYHGWKCPACETQWQMADYAGYFGTITFDKKEPFKLRKLCNRCVSGGIWEQIRHRIEDHGAVYLRLQQTLRYMDHIVDVIPPEEFRKVNNEPT